MEPLTVCGVPVIASPVSEYVQACTDVADQYKKAHHFDSVADLLQLLDEVYKTVLKAMDIVIPCNKFTEKVCSLLTEAGGSLCYLLIDLETKFKETQLCPL
jgi:hypothetical protein